MNNLYADIVRTGEVTDNHESDLYVRYSPRIARLLADSYPEIKFELFSHDGQIFADIPFAYQPFWEGKR